MRAVLRAPRKSQGSKLVEDRIGMVSSTADDVRRRAPSDSLTLRVANGSLQGKIVRLQSAKCTIGSAPGCTLRLRGAGLYPVHCLIVRGEH